MVVVKIFFLIALGTLSVVLAVDTVRLILRKRKQKKAKQEIVDNQEIKND